MWMCGCGVRSMSVDVWVWCEKYECGCVGWELGGMWLCMCALSIASPPQPFPPS